VEVGGVPLAYELRAFPNPFNPTTMIAFSVGMEGNVAVEAFDPAGRMIRSLFRGMAIAGYRYQVPFDARGLSSGTYLVRLSTGEHQRTLKITLMK